MVTSAESMKRASWRRWPLSSALDKVTKKPHEHLERECLGRMEQPAVQRPWGRTKIYMFEDSKEACAAAVE